LGLGIHLISFSQDYYSLINSAVVEWSQSAS